MKYGDVTEGEEAYPKEDEVSLIEMFLILKKRKKWIFYAVLMAILLGAFNAYKVTMANMYSNTTQLEIGSATGYSIFDIKTVRLKLKNSYIPAIKNEFRRKFPGHGTPDVKITSKDEIVLLTLESKGNISEIAFHHKLQKAIIERLQLEYTELLKSAYEDLNRKLDYVKKSIKRLNDPKIFQSRLSRLESSLAEAKIIYVRLLNIKESNMKALSLLSKGGENSGWIAILVNDRGNDDLILRQMSTISDYQNKIDSISDRHYSELTLAAQKEEAIRGRISDIRNIVPITQMISVSIPGRSPYLILALFMMVGLIVGIFSAFIVGFFDITGSSEPSKKLGTS